MTHDPLLLSLKIAEAENDAKNDNQTKDAVLACCNLFRGMAQRQAAKKFAELSHPEARSHEP